MICRSFWRSPTTPIILGSIGAIVLVVGAAIFSSHGQKDHDAAPHMQSFTPRVENKTRSFEVTRARRNLDIDGAGPELSLKNGYDKTITAYAVSVNKLIALVDFAYLDSEAKDSHPIAPGEVYTQWFSCGVCPINHDDSLPREFDIRILAVVFDDKTSDGDEKMAGALLYNRLRSKRLFASVVDLINETSNSLGGSNNLAELKTQISSLSSDPNVAGDTSDVLLWLDQSDQSASPRARIETVKQICQKLIVRL